MKTGPYYFAVWEWRDGAHDGYIDHSSVNAPLMSEYAVGFRGCTTFREAAESVAKHRAQPCDGSCERFLSKVRKARASVQAVTP